MFDHFTGSRVVYKSLVFMGYPDYKVGDDGTVWSRKNNKWGTGDWKKLKLHDFAKGGHLSVTLSNGKGLLQERFAVHELVLKAFVGPRPPKAVCRHFPDRDPGNNRLENLQWGTEKENQQDRIAHGTYQYGEKNPYAKMTNAKVKEMRRLYGEMEHTRKTVDFLAEKFNVFWTNVYSIVGRRTWKHVT